MANLETLEITINANAQSASKGLAGLVGSLRSVARAAGTSAAGLVALNKQLEKLTQFSNIKFTGIEKAASGVKKAVEEVSIPETKLDALKMKMDGVSDAMEKAAKSGKVLSVANKRLQQFTIQKQIDAETKAVKGMTKAELDNFKQFNNNRQAINKASDSYNEEEYQRQFKASEEAYYHQRELDKQRVEEWRKLWSGAKGEATKVMPAVDAFGNKLDMSKPFYDANGNLVQFAKAEDMVTDSTKAMKQEVGKSATPWQDFKDGLKNAGNELKKLIPKVNLFHKVMRIASTMLIRMGLRAAIKGIKEGFDNYYQYAKATGHSFATQMDGVNSSLSQLKNQAGAALATALSAALPVLNALANAAITAFNALSQLFALLTGKNSWSKATAQATDYADAANKAGGSGGGLKEQLAAFDELNVIASESGGGGGGAGAAAESFETMFEESFEFDKNIAAAADILKETFEIIKDNAIAIGMIILGWKLSSEFGGLLGTLGKLAVGAGAVVLGLSLSYEFGNKIGSGAELEVKDYVEGVTGIVATTAGAAFLGFQIAGPWGALVGGVIGLIASVTVTLIAIGDSAAEQIRNLKWGDTDLTPEEMKKYVKSMYTFDVEGEINLLKPKIEMSKATMDKMNDSIARLSASLKKVKLGLETDSSGLANDALTLIKDVQDTYLATNELYKLYVALSPKEIDIEELKTAASPSLETLTEIGKYISDTIADAQKNGWDARKNELIEYYAEYLNDVMTGAESRYTQLEFETKSITGLSGFSRETAEGIFNSQKELESEYAQTIKDAQQTAAAGKLREAALAEEIADRGYKIGANGEHIAIDPAEYRKEAEVARKAAQSIMSDTSYVDDKLAESRKSYLGYWKDALVNAYGGMGYLDFGNMVISDFSAHRLWDTETMTVTAESINNYMKTVMDFVDPLLLEVSDYFGFTGWDILGDESKKEFLKMLNDTFGEDALRAMVDAFNVDAKEIVKFTNWESLTAEGKTNFVNSMVDVFGSSGTIAAILDKTNWDKLSNGTKAQIVAELRKVASDSEIKKVADKIGVDVTDYIDGGVRSGFRKAIENSKSMESFIKVAGKNWQDYINNNWKFISPVVNTYGTEMSMMLLESSARTFGKDINVVLQNWKLIAPTINSTNYAQRLSDLRSYAQRAGVDIKTAMQHWNLIAPQINKYGFEVTYSNLANLAKTTGTDIKYVMSKWNLIAPSINKYGFDQTITTIKTTAQKAGVDVKYLLDRWNLIAPNVGDSKFVQSLLSLKTGATKYGTDINTVLKNWKLIAPLIDEKDIKGSCDRILKLIKEKGDEWRKALPKLLIQLGLDASLLPAEALEIRKTVETSIGTIMIPVGVKSDGSSVETVTNKVTGGTKVSLTTKTPHALLDANGAYDIGRGELFIAQERGAELIGAINGKTSVANQQQIIDGIASGVESANATQNALLREQNNLLRGILEKENSVRIGASAALGRVARQSLDMYGAMVGG